jgi:16S rRNA processing protein RimM
MGRIAGPYGVRGWLRVVSYTRQPEQLLRYAPWYLRRGRAWQATGITEARRRARGLLVRLPECENRDEAAKLAGTDIGIYREQLPEVAADEYYWNDLIGLTVLTLDDTVLGSVDHLIETGANDVLVIRGERERLVPFVPGKVVKQVDLENGEIRVDWEADF